MPVEEHFQKQNGKKLSELPASEDEFWEGAEKVPIINQVLKPNKQHEWHQKGNQAICKSCPFVHAVYLRQDQEVREGKIVKRLLPKSVLRALSRAL